MDITQIDFSDCKIQFPHIKYENSDKCLQVGDVFRMYDADDMSHIGEGSMQEAQYAIYTWIPDYNGYIWAVENELFDYVTCSWDRWNELHHPYENFHTPIEDNMENVKRIGNISEKWVRDKLDQNWLSVYIHLFKF